MDSDIVPVPQLEDDVMMIPILIPRYQVALVYLTFLGRDSNDVADSGLCLLQMLEYLSLVSF